MVQPPLEHGRGRATVLGGAEHDDDVRAVDAAGVVVVRGSPHGHRARTDHDERDQEEERDAGQDGMPTDPGHPSRLTTS